MPSLSMPPQTVPYLPLVDVNLASEESWKAAAQECEGINDTAPLWSYDEILEDQKK